MVTIEKYGLFNLKKRYVVYTKFSKAYKKGIEFNNWENAMIYELILAMMGQLQIPVVTNSSTEHKEED